MDRSWMKELRTTTNYIDGVEALIAFGQKNGADNSGRIYCPCVNCLNECRLYVNEVRNHLVCDGIQTTYKKWIFHGELDSSSDSEQNVDENDIDEDGMEEMIRDVEAECFRQSHAFDSLRSDAETPLYPGSDYTRLSGTLELMNIKATSGWTDSSFTLLLELLCKMLPPKNVLPNRMYEAKKVLSQMGLECQKIHSCPNDCVLYRKEYEHLSQCPKCETPRYKKNKKDEGKKTKRQPLKVMWYLPIVPRLKRLFANTNNAKKLRWHGDERVSDGRYLRHPADSPQWKKIDSMYPEFGGEIRNIRFGLCTDGINPFGNMTSTHSAWPVLLVIYNLPPWLCMKRKYMMLSIMISGPTQPGNDIDVYLAPLIEDLKMLWAEGIDVFDAYKQESFMMRAMIFTTINDFPAYGNLSGYSVKGHKACPICESDTHSHQLKHGRKTVYLGHRRFLPRFHPYRRLRKSFNGFPENGDAPKVLTGIDIYRKVEHLNVTFGKKQKKTVEKSKWKKRSIFFDLPYWHALDVRHSIDVMHVEKNVCDSLVGTLLHISGKTKDGINARLDLKEMGIREQLHPHVRDDGKRAYLPPAAYTLSKKEKKSFCECLHTIKVPQGYSSNVRSLVSVDDLKLVGMKSHDFHVLMQQLLPVAIRGIMRDDVRKTITRLCIFFNAVCSKVIDSEKLDELEKEGYLILSQLEMHFAPAFFDIMVHLVVHLVREIRLCGPVYLRWMYPFERYMKILKGYSKNPYRPEASIVERYLVEEGMDFCKEYISGVDVSIRHEDGTGRGTRGYRVTNPAHEDVIQAHLCILYNTEEVQPYLEEHMQMLIDLYPKKTSMQIDIERRKTFIPWFKKRVEQDDTTSDTLKLLAWGPSFLVGTWSGYDVNGYSFYTKAQDDKSTMQNSGVMVNAEGMHYSSSKDKNPVFASLSYYGVIEEIWEIDYATELRVGLFKCKWVHNNAVVIDQQYGFTSVDLNRIGYKNDPFILASLVKQVFYVSDPAKKNMSIVLPSKKQHGGDPTMNADDTPPFSTIPPSIGVNEILVDDDGYFAERNDHCEGIWENT